MVTAWDPEPTEISHLVRCTCAAIVYNTTWQALQAGGWSDDQLAQLQHEWESADFFKGLPDTEVFARACHVTTCQLERQQPLFDLSLFLQAAAEERWAEAQKEAEADRQALHEGSV